MKCVICKQGDTRPGQVHVALQRGNSMVVIKNVPAHVCVNCQEYYLAAEQPSGYSLKENKRFSTALKSKRLALPRNNVGCVELSGRP
jgi:YgiT-type zinc finger domain-containing protein